MTRSIALHAALLGIASLISLSFWTRDELPASQRTDKVMIWEATSERLTEIGFKSKDRSVSLYARKDENGPYFEGRHESRDPLPEGHPTLGAADKGKVKKDKAKITRFIATAGAETLAKDVAPLLALRRIGRVDKKRDAEFGLDAPDGTLIFKFGSLEQSLEVGGLAPGEEDIYVRYTKTGEVYAVSRDVVNRVRYADSRLMEHALHAFKVPEESLSVRIEKGDRKRDLVPVEGKVDGFADASQPGKLDETAGNWMASVRRLRLTEFVEKPEKVPGASQLVARVRYSDKGNEVGFLELYNMGPDEEGETQYLGRTEHSRWYFKLLKTSVEQIERDLPSVLRNKN
ncbi:MAG: DUF4340 domain-containing protein [Polyangiaceae bacterium]|nr:DUF4340 domain-containing protein [Polyangiaceae bacterium]